MEDGRILMPGGRPVRVISQRLKKKIDLFLKKNGLNEYGDSPGTVYTGGTPLFDETGGGYQDRYQRVLEKYPELNEED